MKLFVEFKGGEKAEVEDFIQVSEKETFKLSSNKTIHVSCPDECVIDNYGTWADVQFFSLGRHRLKINHRVVYVLVKQFVPQATLLNIKIGKISSISV